MKDGLIGIFDSGIGGLTVVKEIRKILPRERIVYFGDTARVPYGNKSKSTIIKFSLQNILFLLRHKVKIVVIACNTSSSIALPIIRKQLRIPILGVISPGAKEAVYATRNRRIGVIGTKATISSGSYEKEIKKIDPGIKIISKACPLFVPLVEEGWVRGDVAERIARVYLQPIKDFGADTLILGCTHYPLLRNTIQKIMGKKVVLIDSAIGVAKQVKEILRREKLMSQGNISRKNESVFYVTDDVEQFFKLGGKFLNKKIKNIFKVNDV